MKKKTELSTKNWIVKSNILNEIRNNKMTISQIRFFSIYLSKINPKDSESREVVFKLDEYTRIMQFKQTNVTRLMKTAEDLLGITAAFKEKDGGFTVCQMFKRFKLFKRDDGEWYVSIDCHDDMLERIFEFRGYYFKYQLWNALQLTSPNQQRMYEILKQYEYAGAREISVKDLREFLGIEPDEYERWERFKVRVLEASQQALGDYTDIKFTWEITGKRGKGGKINKLKFNVEKNNDYIKQLTFDEYLTEQQRTEFEDEPKAFERECDKSTIINQIEQLNFIKERLSNDSLLSILNAAKGDVALIRRRYCVANNKSGSINNLAGFLIWACKQADEQFTMIGTRGKNKFVNFEQRNIDFDEIERKEREFLKKQVNG